MLYSEQIAHSKKSKTTVLAKALNMSQHGLSHASSTAVATAAPVAEGGLIRHPIPARVFEVKQARIVQGCAAVSCDASLYR